MNRSKTRGTAAETAVCAYLTSHGFAGAERRALRGNHDGGDVTGCGPLVFEVKDERDFEIAAALDEATKERANMDADYGVVIRRRRGKPNVGEWYAVLPVADLVRLLREAGYGDSLGTEAFEQTFGGGV